MRNIAVMVFIMAMAAAAELCGQHEAYKMGKNI